jgi:Na+-transporting methylmalonyl-CoA/oxaloacetate decarboxylase gamma subunit
MGILSLLALNMADLGKSWEIMWKGVVAIFVVITLIIVVTKIVNKICVSADIKREERKKAQEAEEENPANS